MKKTIFLFLLIGLFLIPTVVNANEETTNEENIEGASLKSDKEVNENIDNKEELNEEKLIEYDTNEEKNNDLKKYSKSVPDIEKYDNQSDSDNNENLTVNLEPNTPEEINDSDYIVKEESSAKEKNEEPEENEISNILIMGNFDQFEESNTSIENPNTSDDTITYIMLSAISLIGIVICIFTYKKIIN